MDGLNLTDAAVLSGNLGPIWHVDNAQDVNGDGRADNCAVRVQGDGVEARRKININCGGSFPGTRRP